MYNILQDAFAWTLTEYRLRLNIIGQYFILPLGQDEETCRVMLFVWPYLYPRVK